MKNMKEVTIAVTEETLAKIDQLMVTRSRTMTRDELLQSLLQRAVEDRLYRTKRNAAQYAELKQYRAMIAR